MPQALIAGFSLGITLILVIGAQNAFVLRQGIRGVHVLPVVLFSAVSDSLLIAAGVLGFGAVAKAYPNLVILMCYFAAAFLLLYGAMNFYSAWRGGKALHLKDGQSRSLWGTLLTLAALIWLNPHVYLDTVVLLGSLSQQYEDWLCFGIGAAAASFIFFFSIGYGGRLLRPYFQSETSWRVLDFIFGCIMWVIAIKLLFFS